MFAAVAAGCRLGVCPLPQVRGYEEDGDDADGNDDESTAAGSSDEPDVDAAVTPARKAKGSVAPPSASKGAKGKASKAKSSGGVHDKAEARGSGDLDSDVIRVHVSDGIAKNPLFFECVYALEDAWVDVVLHFPPSTRKVVGAPRWGRQRPAQPGHKLTCSRPVCSAAPGAQAYPPCTHRIPVLICLFLQILMLRTAELALQKSLVRQTKGITRCFVTSQVRVRAHCDERGGVLHRPCLPVQA